MLAHQPSGIESFLPYNPVHFKEYLPFSPGPEQPFVSYGAVLRRMFGTRVQKISLNTNKGCPHRGTGPQAAGCAWCRPESFMPSYCSGPSGLMDQLEQGIAFFSRKDQGGGYLAFLQGYTSTLGSPAAFLEAASALMSRPGVRGLVVASRPDSLEPEVISGLGRLARKGFVCVELGVESCRDTTLAAMNRGHTYAQAVDAVWRLSREPLFIGLHLILGLPGDSIEDQVGFAPELSRLPVHFLKLHHLQILQGTLLEKELEEGRLDSDFRLHHPEGYQELCIRFLERLRPDIVVDRFTNEAPPQTVIAPRWEGIKNQEFAQKLYNAMRFQGRWQGMLHEHC